MKQNTIKQNLIFPKITPLVVIVLVGSAILFTGCAESITHSEPMDREPAGFLYGLWHGFIAPVSFIISLFDPGVAIYAIYNNGGWYDFGFLLGISCSIGGSSKAT